jgi:predicted Kef-type K+ transport protein
VNPAQAIPAKVRFFAYVAYLIAGPVLIYTSAKGWTGDDEWALYAGLGTVFGLTAAGNVFRVKQRITAGVKPPEV